MTNANRWFKLASSYYMDPKIVKLSAHAELLFVRALAMISQSTADGRISADQLQFICRGLRSVRSSAAELVRSGLWSVADDSSADGESFVVVSHRKWTPEISVPAAQPAKKAAPKSMDQPRVRAHVEREREKEEKESVRSPPGSDRTDSARAAPGRANGPARPAPRMGELRAPYDPEPDMVEPASKAAEQCRQTIRSSKKATGRNPMQSKWNREQNDYRSFDDTIAPINDLLGDVE